MPGWSYSEMSKIAAAAGGPEKYVQTLVNSGVAKGLVKGRTQGVMIAFGAAGIAYVCKKAFDYFTPEPSIEDVEEAKEVIIQGIKEEGGINNEVLGRA